MCPKPHISRHPRCYAQATGLVAAMCFAVLSFTVLVWGAARESQAFHEKSAEVAFAVLNDVNGVLDTLHEKHAHACTEDDLGRLRTLLFSSRYVKDIGVLGPDGRSQCSTTRGMDLQAHPRFVPDVVFQRKGRPIEIAYSIPVQVGDKTFHTTVIHEGGFSAILDHFTIDRLASTGMNVVGLALPDRFVAIGSASNLSPQTDDFLQNPDRWRRNEHKFVWREMAFHGTTWLAPSPYVFHSIRPLAIAGNLNLTVISIIAAFGAFVGLLAFKATFPVYASWASIEKRIQGILRPDNILSLYQPIVDICTGEIVGCESLMRLQADDEVLTPDQFMDAVLSRGLDWDLDTMMLGHSLTELAQHVPLDCDLKVAFNLFPQNVRSKPLHELISRQLEKNPHPGLRINLEIIERDYRDELIEETRQLKALGYLITVDDFGTGFSNLRSIKALAPHYLKIDKSFVHDMEDETVRSTLIPEILALARAAGAEVVAEGVENEWQRLALQRMGVKYGQGFYFARPMPIQTLAAVLRDQISRSEECPSNLGRASQSLTPSKTKLSE